MSNFGNADKDTRWGPITMRNPGRKNPPPNLTRYNRPEGDVVLQAAAIRSFKEAERAATPRRVRRKGKVLPILITGVGYRAYDYQAALYNGQTAEERARGRYADPDGSMHVEALAVDVSMAQGITRRARIKHELKKRGWFYPIDGEPWHASFGWPG